MQMENYYNFHQDEDFRRMLELQNYHYYNQIPQAPPPPPPHPAVLWNAGVFFKPVDVTEVCVNIDSLLNRYRHTLTLDISKDLTEKYQQLCGNKMIFDEKATPFTIDPRMITVLGKNCLSVQRSLLKGVEVIQQGVLARLKDKLHNLMNVGVESQLENYYKANQIQQQQQTIDFLQNQVFRMNVENHELRQQVGYGEGANHQVYEVTNRFVNGQPVQRTVEYEAGGNQIAIGNGGLQNNMAYNIQDVTHQ